jgi:phosphatidate phosphatase PAH1
MTTQKGKPFKDTSTEMSLEEIPEPFRNVLSEIIDKKINTEPLKRVTKVISKPLPQILDEMDENIRTAAEASSKAEEAARLAKQAAIDAHSASNKAEKQAEESLISGMKAAKKATQAAQKTVEQFKKTKQDIRKFEAMVLKRIESVEKKLLNIEGFLPSENIILLREISKKEAEKEIRKLFSEGQDLYYSDIAERLRLDLQLVVEICNELQNRGEIKVNDNTL